MRVIYFGTPDFAVPALEALAGSHHRPQLVVTRPDRPRGRGHKLTPCPVKSKAVELGINVDAPETLRGNTEFFDRLKSLEPDLIVVAAYGNILPNEVLNVPRLGSVNIHASKLPKYRGAAPIHRAVLSGEEETGISLMYMSEKLDEGDVIAVSSIAIGEMTTGQVEVRLAHLGASLLLEHMPLIEAGKAEGRPQDGGMATYAPMVAREEGHIDFSAGTADALNRIRAMTPAPGAYAVIGGEAWKIHKAKAAAEGELAEAKTAAPGDIIGVGPAGITVRTVDGGIILERIQIPGKRPMDVSDYLRGHGLDKTERFT